MYCSFCGLNAVYVCMLLILSKFLLLLCESPTDLVFTLFDLVLEIDACAAVLVLLWG